MTILSKDFDSYRIHRNHWFWICGRTGTI